MKVISICNHKGGSGKTTCAIHIAAALTLIGKKTMAIDLDPQGFMTRMLGLSEPPENKSAMTLFGPHARWEKQHVETLPDFDFIPSSTALTTGLKKYTRPTDVLWLKETLSECHDYDYVVLDTSSSVTVYTLNALTASQSVIIPVVPEYLPVIGAEQTFQTCSLVKAKLNPDLELPLFLLTQVDGRKNIHEKYRRYLQGTYGAQVMKHAVRTNANLSEETLRGRSVFRSEPHSKGAVDFANITDELLRRLDHTFTFDEQPENTFRIDKQWKPLVDL